jgi:hypothetical protein
LSYDVTLPEFLTTKALCTQGIGGTGRGDAILTLDIATGRADLEAEDASIGCEIFVSAAADASRGLRFLWTGSAEEIPMTTGFIETRLGAAVSANFHDSATGWAMGWVLNLKCPELSLDQSHSVQGNWSPGTSTSVGLEVGLGRALAGIGLSVQGTIPTTVGSSPRVSMMNNQGIGSGQGIKCCHVNAYQACGASAYADGGLFGTSSVNGRGISQINFALRLNGP